VSTPSPAWHRRADVARWSRELSVVTATVIVVFVAGIFARPFELLIGAVTTIGATAWLGLALLTGGHAVKDTLRLVWPTLATTLLLSPLVGWLPALLQSREERRAGRDGSLYWKAYGASIGAMLTVAVVLGALAALSTRGG